MAALPGWSSGPILPENMAITTVKIRFSRVFARKKRGDHIIKVVRVPMMVRTTLAAPTLAAAVRG